MSQQHPILIDLNVLTDEQRKAFKDFFFYIYENELHEGGDDVWSCNFNRPLFLCNTISKFWPFPMMFSIAGIEDIEKKVYVHVQHEFKDGKWITFKNWEKVFIPIDEFKQLIKTLVFIPLYIPDNCSFYPL